MTKRQGIQISEATTALLHSAGFTTALADARYLGDRTAVQELAEEVHAWGIRHGGTPTVRFGFVRIRPIPGVTARPGHRGDALTTAAAEILATAQ